MKFLLADLGVKALYLTYVWLASCVASSWLSDRKGYGERPGLITSLLTSFLGTFVWLVIPAKPDSRWKVQGAIPRRRGEQRTVAEARAAHEGESDSGH